MVDSVVTSVDDNSSGVGVTSSVVDDGSMLVDSVVASDWVLAELPGIWVVDGVEGNVVETVPKEVVGSVVPVK